MNGGWRAAHFLSRVVGHGEGFALHVAGTDRALAAAARLAGDSGARRRGLLGMDALPPGEALVIAPTQGVHTFGMRFVIDIVFVDRAGRVVRIAPAVPPSRCRLAWRAFAAVELPEGTCQTADLNVGDSLLATPLQQPEVSPHEVKAGQD